MNEYANLGQFDRRTVRELYDLWSRSQHLLDIETQFGARDEQVLTAKPLVRWEPTQDQYSLGGRSANAVQPREPGGLNQLSTVRSKHLRKAGVSLLIFGSTDEEAEDAIARTVLALEQAFGAEANCAITSGTWKLARARSTSCERYELRIVLALPVVRVLPAAIPTSYSITPVEVA